MKKNVIAILLCIGMIVSLLMGCGSKQEDSDTESSETISEEETAVSDEPSEEESNEPNEYGLTEEQQEALLSSVKDSITKEYLEKYNIPAADFKLLPYDVNDLNNYDSSGTYSGTDPYECARMWSVVDGTICTSNDLGVRLATSVAARDTALLEKEDNIFEETLDAQNQKNKGDGFSYVLDTSSEHYSLMNAVYMGIVKFTNAMDAQERAEVLYNLYEVSHSNSEMVSIGGAVVGTTTIFDKVISENIQFE